MHTWTIDEELLAALDNYRGALEGAGLEVLGTIEVVTPFGSGLYVARTGLDGRTRHDLPGFCAPVGAGFGSYREVVDALWLAAKTVTDMHEALAELSFEYSL